jgi:hypothetical protein
MTDPDADFVHAVFPDIALRQEPFDIQDVCPDKLHGRGAAPPPEQVDVQRVVIDGNSDMIVVVRVVVTGPSAVFLQQRCLIDPAHQMLELRQGIDVFFHFSAHLDCEESRESTTFVATAESGDDHE